LLFSMDILNAQIKVSELAATPVDVLNDFYFKGGSLNGKFKMSLEKVMANVDVEEFNYDRIIYMITSMVIEDTFME